jgi:hypothetical protein
VISLVQKRLISLPLAGGALLLSTGATIPPAAVPFPSCPNLGYMFSSATGGQSTLSFYDISTASLVPIKDLVLGSLPIVVNAAGYSGTQNVFWGVRAVKNPPQPGVGPFPDEIVRVDSVGNADSIGPPGNLAALGYSDFLALAGTVQGNKAYLHTKVPANHLFVIDVDPASPTLGNILTDVTLSRMSPGNPDSMLNIGDWDYDDLSGELFGVELSGGKRKVVRVNPASGLVTDVADLSADLPDSDNYGAVFMEDGTTNLYVSANNANMAGQSKTFMIRLDLTPPLVQPLGSSSSLRINDGADCLLATDFGDAPSGYKTSSAEGGPAHVMSQVFNPADRFSLGATVDSDIDGFPSAGADTDDKNVPANDEDAVPAGTVLNSNAPSLTVPITNNTGRAGLLAGYLDLNGDGAFAPDELATAAAPASNGTATLTWPAATVSLKRTGTAAQGKAYDGPVVHGRYRGGPVAQGKYHGDPASHSESLARAVTPSMLRLRLYADPAAVPDNTTWVNGGEMEDHLVSLEPGAVPPVPPVPPVDPAPPGDPAPVNEPAPVAGAAPGAPAVEYVYDPATGEWLPQTGSATLRIALAGGALAGLGALFFGAARIRRPRV